MRRASWLISLLMVLMGMVACSGPEKSTMPNGEMSADQQQTVLRGKVTALLEKRSYRRAIELMSNRNHPGSPAVGMEKEYLTAINGLIATGEEFHSHGDYEAAGQSFRAALDFYPVKSSLRGRVKLDPQQLKKQLETCASRLLDQGLIEYRNGNLQNAIRKWKEIVVFDADHKEALKAIETATVQLRSLKDIEKPRQ